MALADRTKEEQTILRTVVCPDASDIFIDYYLRVCAARQVDPFSGLLYLQIRTTKGKPKPVVASTIDGARAMAARCEGYAGSDEPEYDGEEGDFPKWCRSTVYRMVGGERCAFSSKIRWSEFVPAPPNDFQWKLKPYHMLGKCAEAQSLRKAFPESVAGANEDEYEAEETGDTGKTTEKAKVVLAAAPQVVTQWGNALQAFKVLHVDEKALLAKIKKDALKDVTEEDLESLRLWYEELTRDQEKS